MSFHATPIHHVCLISYGSFYHYYAIFQSMKYERQHIIITPFYATLFYTDVMTPREMKRPRHCLLFITLLSATLLCLRKEMSLRWRVTCLYWRDADTLKRATPAMPHWLMKSLRIVYATYIFMLFCLRLLRPSFLPFVCWHATTCRRATYYHTHCQFQSSSSPFTIITPLISRHRRQFLSSLPPVIYYTRSHHTTPSYYHIIITRLFITTPRISAYCLLSRRRHLFHATTLPLFVGLPTFTPCLRHATHTHLSLLLSYYAITRLNCRHCFEYLPVLSLVAHLIVAHHFNIILAHHTLVSLLTGSHDTRTYR